MIIYDTKLSVYKFWPAKGLDSVGISCFYMGKLNNGTLDANYKFIPIDFVNILMDQVKYSNKSM